MKPTTIAVPLADPVLPLYSRWREAKDRWERMTDLPEQHDWITPEINDAEDCAWQLFQELAKTNATSFQGLRLQARALHEEFGHLLANGSFAKQKLQYPPAQMLASIAGSGS